MRDGGFRDGESEEFGRGVLKVGGQGQTYSGAVIFLFLVLILIFYTKIFKFSI